ncbi:MAG: hypothetical protein Q7U34_10750 [Anaerolineales bacterium]|nr:hypothetical protein [Anaerolineales bacterium]
MQVALLDGKRHAFTLFGAAFLVRRGGADGGIEGYIVSLAVGRARLDVTSTLALGART